MLRLILLKFALKNGYLFKETLCFKSNVANVTFLSKKIDQHYLLIIFHPALCVPVSTVQITL